MPGDFPASQPGVSDCLTWVKGVEGQGSSPKAIELGSRRGGQLVELRLPPGATWVKTEPFSQSAVTHIHGSSIFQFLRRTFSKPTLTSADQPSRKSPHRLFRSSTSRVNSQDGYVRLNFFQAFVCKWMIGNGLCEYDGAANSPPSEEFGLSRQRS